MTWRDIETQTWPRVNVHEQTVNYRRHQRRAYEVASWGLATVVRDVIAMRVATHSRYQPPGLYY